MGFDTIEILNLIFLLRIEDFCYNLFQDSSTLSKRSKKDQQERFVYFVIKCQSDMEKGADTGTLSAEIFEKYGIFLTVEDYAPLFSEEN